MKTCFRGYIFSFPAYKIYDRIRRKMAKRHQLFLVRLFGALTMPGWHLMKKFPNGSSMIALGVKKEHK